MRRSAAVGRNPRATYSTRLFGTVATVKILVVKPSSLGDIVHALFAVQALRVAMPSAEIWWVANDSLSSIVSLCPGIRAIPFPRKSWGRLRGFLHELRVQEFDAVLDFQGLLRSALISWAARSPSRYGFRQSREGARFFYTRRVDLPSGIDHAVEKNLYLVKEFLGDRGLAMPEVPGDISLSLPAEWQEEADRLVAAHGFAGRPLLAVGASSRWASKSWAEEYFSEVLKGVLAARPEVAVWLLGSPDERDRAERVRMLCGSRAVVNLAGLTSMGGLCALLSRSNALFTNDSGPMHIAALEGVPCVANFGSTNPSLTGPYGPPGRHYVVKSLCPQSPCFQRECPRGDNSLCSQGIGISVVVGEILKRLDVQSTLVK